MFRRQAIEHRSQVFVQSTVTDRQDRFCGGVSTHL